MKKIILTILGVVILGVAWYTLSPLLNNKKLDDPTPSSTSMSVDSTTTQSETKLFTPVTIIDTPAHPASGTARLVQTGDQYILRYENYKTINGPDVRVYLAADTKATDYVDLGPLKATEGNINYNIPAGTDLEKYHYALTWCEDFSVLFNSADLSKK